MRQSKIPLGSGGLAAFVGRSRSMNDIYKINIAKTEFREAYNTGDVDRLLAVFTDDRGTSMFDGEPGEFGGGARSSVRVEPAKRFADESVQTGVDSNDITA